MDAILVTGGAGFIGSNLCKTLLAQGKRVFAVDNLITGKRENITPLLDNPLFSFHELDVSSPEFVKTFRGNEKIDAIYHFACPTGVPNLVTLAEEMIRASSIGTLNVLDLAKKHEARVLFASSAEMYGDPEKFPQDENYTGNADPIGPRSAYEEGKRFGEACVAAYARKYNLEAKIVRIFNTYGPGMSLSDTRVIPGFISSILAQKPLTIYGEGQQTRSHLYIDDLLRGLQIVIERGSPGEAYNVGGAEPKTIVALAELLMGMANYSAGIVYKPHFIQDHRGRQPSVEKVRALGWEQTISLEEGLKKMLAHYSPAAAEAKPQAEITTQVAPA